MILRKLIHWIGVLTTAVLRWGASLRARRWRIRGLCEGLRRLALQRIVCAGGLTRGRFGQMDGLWLRRRRARSATPYRDWLTGFTSGLFVLQSCLIVFSSRLLVFSSGLIVFAACLIVLAPCLTVLASDLILFPPHLILFPSRLTLLTSHPTLLSTALLVFSPYLIVLATCRIVFASHLIVLATDLIRRFARRVSRFWTVFGGLAFVAPRSAFASAGSVLSPGRPSAGSCTFVYP